MTICLEPVARDVRGCRRPEGHDGTHEPFLVSTVVVYRHPKQIGELLENGRPRKVHWSASGFDLSWAALDAWSRSQASHQPCEIIITGHEKREDGAYFYIEAVNPDWLIAVQGWTWLDGRLAPICPECGRYPKHARGCAAG